MGTKGGLWVGWKASLDLSCIVKCPNYVLLKVTESSLKFWYLCCVYGEPKKSKRAQVCSALEHYISTLDSHFLILGDFNQIEFLDDKLGGSQGTPYGAQAFSEWKARNGLSDVAFKDPKYTWCNHRKGHGRVYERLDKCLASSSWQSHFPNTGIKHLPIQASDHAPIILDTEFFSSKSRRPFKMEACSALVDAFDGKDVAKYEEIHAKYLEFNKAAAIYWKQRSKINWIKEGFQGIMSPVSRVLQVCGYMRRTIFVNVLMITLKTYMLPHLIRNLLIPFFSKYIDIFAHICHKLSPDQQEKLSKPYTRKEVRCAVFQLGPTKSPGPDGIPALFYQKYWYHIKDDVTNAVLSMLTTGHILKSFNSTNIALIPKVSSPETVDQFRSISLCNVIMKIVTKCVCNRLKPFMSFLVGDFQNGFIPGRNISDNILVSHELFHQISKKTTGKQGLLAFKIDMSKAYDRLSWNFLKATLVSMNFPPSLITLIMNCVSSVTYSTLLNGVVGVPKAGIRQGDPISPYLFALCTETFSQMIQDAQQRRLLKGIKMCRQAPMISHLLFADDSIFFLEAQQQNCKNLMHIIDYYCEASGQCLNPSKSAVTLSPNRTLRNTQKCIKLLRVSAKKDLGVYLGLPTDFGSSKKLIFATLIEKVRKRIISWNNINLTPAGRLTLICSVLSSLSIYSLSAFQMPISVSNKIDSMLSHFWWSGSNERGSLHWSSRLFISSPKSMGGLGIRNVRCLNQSLLAKVSWRMIQNPDSLVSDITIKPTISVCQLQNNRGEWDVPLVHSICGEQVAPLVLSIALPPEDFQDSLYWTKTNDVKMWKPMPTYSATAPSPQEFGLHLLWRIAHLETDLCSSLRLISEEGSMNASIMSDHNRCGSLSCNYSHEDDLDTTNIRNFYPYFLIGTHLCSTSIRIKCDASWNPSLRATAGWLFQDNNGTMIHTGSSRFWASTPLQAEAMTLKLAISKAISCGYRHIDASSDCLSLILQVSGHATMDQAAKATLLSLQSMFLQLHCFSISHCPRNLNRVAHSIAKSAMV
ncbi:uncharacterized protein LOC141618543 [Silene latifolia]|uniref:uncharacterized protein LOC141618543 n=1 Tax=Silene latifolia TaxID=37657 RepID=UPI003D776733